MARRGVRRCWRSPGAGAFDRFSEGMSGAVGASSGPAALAAMARAYEELSSDRTTLLLQLQGLAACVEHFPNVAVSPV